MTLIKKLPIIIKHTKTYKNQFNTINNLIKTILNTTQYIIKFKKLPTIYITNKNPKIKTTLTHFPITIY